MAWKSPGLSWYWVCVTHCIQLLVQSHPLPTSSMVGPQDTRTKSSASDSWSIAVGPHHSATYVDDSSHKLHRLAASVLSMLALPSARRVRVGRPPAVRSLNTFMTMMRGTSSSALVRKFVIPRDEDESSSSPTRRRCGEFAFTPVCEGHRIGVSAQSAFGDRRCCQAIKH